jgi:mRNA interferase MazF
MQRGDLYWVRLPEVDGREQAGIRPAVIVQDPVVGGALPTVLVVPLTSQLAAARFPGTLRIEPDDENQLSTTSVLLVFQLRAIDRRRLAGRLGRIGSAQLERIYEMLDELLGCAPSTWRKKANETSAPFVAAR